jgi:hypothetical protein
VLPLRSLSLFEANSSLIGAYVLGPNSEPKLSKAPHKAATCSKGSDMRHVSALLVAAKREGRHASVSE